MSTDTHELDRQPYEKIEGCFDLRISSSGETIGVKLKTSDIDRVWMDYEEWLGIRNSLEALIESAIQEARREQMELLYWKYKEMNAQSVDVKFAEAYAVLMLELGSLTNPDTSTEKQS